MKETLRIALSVSLSCVLLAGPALSAPQSQSQDPSQDPSKNPPSTQPTAPPAQQPTQPQTTPPPQPPAKVQTTPAPVSQPVQQQDTVSPKNSKEDVEAIGNRNVSGKVNFYSIEKEIAIGKSLAQEVERSSKMIDDPVVTEYVNRVGQNLVRNSDAKVPFTIKVIDSDEVNAFALPGGFFYVN